MRTSRLEGGEFATIRAYREVLVDQRRLMRTAVAEWRGAEVDTEGDAFFVVFREAADAVAAAVAAQRALAAHPWPDGRSVRVRMGVHTGAATFADGGYVGLEVHRAARVCAAAPTAARSW